MSQLQLVYYGGNRLFDAVIADTWEHNFMLLKFGKIFKSNQIKSLTNAISVFFWK